MIILVSGSKRLATKLQRLIIRERKNPNSAYFDAAAQNASSAVIPLRRGDSQCIHIYAEKISPFVKLRRLLRQIAYPWQQ